MVLNFNVFLMFSSVDDMDKMEEFFVEPFVAEEIDLDYEFDAAKYYDFTRLETEMEAREAEYWFDSAGSYPPSPFVIKLNGRRIMLRKCTTAESKDGQKINNVGFESMESEIPAQDENILVSQQKPKWNSNECLIHESLLEEKIIACDYYTDIQEIEVKPPVKTNLSRSSTLMKPTASHLAKKKQPPGVHTNRLKQRHKKNLSGTEGKDSLNSSIYLSQYTKRQKLEAGFVRKAAQLTHQPLLLHKIPQKDGRLGGIATIRKSKVTVPQEPNLATAHRALRRSRLRNDEVQSLHSNASSHVYKGRTLNRKILEAPTLPPPKKSVPQMPEFQVFNLKTSERAAHHLSNDLETSCSKSISQAEKSNTKRPSYLSASKREKSRINKSKNVSLCKKILSPKDVDDLQGAEREKTIPKQNTFETQKPRLEEPPVLLFSKLSLKSDSQHNTKSQCSMPMPDKVVNAY